MVWPHNVCLAYQLNLSTKSQGCKSVIQYAFTQMDKTISFDQIYCMYTRIERLECVRMVIPLIIITKA